jgi:hypothetical protein
VFLFSLKKDKNSYNNASMKPTKTPFELLTFYHFVDIPEQEIESIVSDHLSFCHDIGLRGRIYI